MPEEANVAVFIDIRLPNDAVSHSRPQAPSF